MSFKEVLFMARVLRISGIASGVIFCLGLLSEGSYDTVSGGIGTVVVAVAYSVAFTSF